MFQCRMFAILAAVLSYQSTGCVSIHSTRPVEVVVTSHETGEPLAGVPVSVNYIAMLVLNLPESASGVTDETGRVVIPLANFERGGISFQVGDFHRTISTEMVVEGGVVNTSGPAADPAQKPKLNVQLIPQRRPLVERLFHRASSIEPKDTIAVKPLSEHHLPQEIPGERYTPSIHCAAVRADGETLLIGGGNALGPGQLSFRSLLSGTETVTYKQHKFAVCSVAISPDDKHSATGGGCGEVKLWDNATGKVLAHLDAGSAYTYSVAFSPDGKLLVNGGDQSVRVWDVETHKCLADLPNIGKSGHHAVAFSTDGKTLALGENAAVVRLWDVETWKEKEPIKGLYPRLASGIYGQIGTPVYSPDGKFLAIEGGYCEPVNYSIKLWDIAAARVVGEWKGHRDSILSMVFTPDSKYLVTGSSDHSIKVWDVATGQEVASWVAHKSTIRNLALSRDGKYLVSCGDDEVARVWNFHDVLKMANSGEQP